MPHSCCCRLAGSCQTAIGCVGFTKSSIHMGNLFYYFSSVPNSLYYAPCLSSMCAYGYSLGSSLLVVKQPEGFRRMFRVKILFYIAALIAVLGVTPLIERRLERVSSSGRLACFFDIVFTVSRALVHSTSMLLPLKRVEHLIYPLRKALPQPNSRVLAEFAGGLVGLTMELHVGFVPMLHSNKKNQHLISSDFRTFSA